jgi:acetyltransferase-like isoleucine patch superfamily enzyme
VVKDVPENAIVAGVPAKIIGYKDKNNLNFQG